MTEELLKEELQTLDIQLNMGPQHPSTHGVLRVILTLDGEVIHKADPVIGYLHRGMEKLGESLNYAQFVPYTDRLDYVQSMFNNIAYCQAVEKLVQLEVPQRAEYIRVIMFELTRLASHLIWLGTHALDIGAWTVLLWCFREREQILDIYDSYCGQRLTHNGARIGGMPHDLSDETMRMIERFVDTLPGYIDQYEALLTENRIWLNRTVDVGVITKEQAINLGLSGPMARGSGVDWDIRRDQPYSVYPKLDFIVPVKQNGDTYDRYLVRLIEMRQSCRIIKQCLSQIPDGDHITPDLRYRSAPRELIKKDMAVMANHFNFVIHGFKAPKGEIYHCVESPKGELGFYLASDGGSKPLRLRVRSCSLVNLSSITTMIKNRRTFMADMAAIIGSIDIIMAEIDR